MQTLQVTFFMACKVWWSYSWRVIVLWIPVGIVMGVVIVAVVFPFGAMTGGVAATHVQMVVMQER
jgi:hypothetical protein